MRRDKEIIPDQVTDKSDADNSPTVHGNPDGKWENARTDLRGVRGTSTTGKKIGVRSRPERPGEDKDQNIDEVRKEIATS